MSKAPILAFDFGTHHIGVAVGQWVTQTASPLTILKAKQGQPNWDAVAVLVETWQPSLFVVGLPFDMHECLLFLFATHSLLQRKIQESLQRSLALLKNSPAG